MYQNKPLLPPVNQKLISRKLYACPIPQIAGSRIYPSNLASTELLFPQHPQGGGELQVKNAKKRASHCTLAELLHVELGLMPGAPSLTSTPGSSALIIIPNPPRPHSSLSPWKGLCHPVKSTSPFAIFSLHYFLFLQLEVPPLIFSFPRFSLLSNSFLKLYWSFSLPFPFLFLWKLPPSFSCFSFLPWNSG